MRLLINGQEGAQADMFKGAGGVYKGHLMEDDGTVIDLTAGTTTLEFYDTEDRRNAVTLSAAIGGATAGGYFTVTLTDANAALFTAGARYFAFGKRVVSTDVSFATKPTYFNIK